MEEFPISIEFLMSTDSIICMVSGAVAGLLVTQFVKGWGFGLIGNILLGIIGGVLSGALVNYLDFMNVGDYADPIIAGVVGAAILLGIAGAFRR